MADTVRKYIAEVVPTKEQCGAIKLIFMKEGIAQAAVENRNFAEGTDQIVITAYYKAALDNYAEAQHQKNEWWKEMISTYKLPAQVSFDFDTDFFYVTVPVTSPKTQE